MKRKKLLSILIMCSMIATQLIPAVSYGANFTDTKGHWATSYIDKAVQYGFVDGYPDSTFRPDKPVTRAEFTKMLNNALGNTATASISFTDVPSSEWFYPEVAKAYSATYVGGYEDNTFRPNSAISRQEAAVMISRVIPAYGSTGNLSEFADRSSIADWAYTAFQKVNGKKYIGAYDDGRLHPLDNLTRAQTAKIFCDILDNENIVKSDPIIRSGTTLSNTIYSNGVTLSSDLGSGSATIENCVILGNLIVQGGGSVNFSNSRAAQATVEKSSSSVSFTVRGESVIPAMTAAREATILTSGLTGGQYGRGIDSLTTLSSSNIVLQGTFPKVSVNGSSAKLRLSSGSIEALTVSNYASGSDITIDSGASVNTVDVNAQSYFHGTGTISRMNVNANGVTYEQKPYSVVTGSQYSNPNTSTNTTDDSEIKFNPANGATSVSLDTTITITFDSEMTLYNGNTIKDSNIEDIVDLRESTSVGTKLYYTATINSAKTKITITPENQLKDNTRYYVIMAKNVVKDYDGNGNAAQSISFSTGRDSAFTTFYPANNATSVSVSIQPTITFSEAIEPYSSSQSLTPAFFKDRAIIFRENDEDGDNVSFTASYDSSSRRVTIKPTSNLTNGTYYLGIADRTIRTESKKTTISSSVTWVVGSVTPSVTNVTATPSGTSLTIKATANFVGTMYFLVRGPSETKPTTNSGVTTMTGVKSVTVSSAGTYTSPAFTGLDASLTYTYYVILRIGSSTYTYSPFTTYTVAMTPTPTYGISLSQTEQYKFKDEEYGYGAQTALKVTVSNAGNNPTGDLVVSLSDPNNRFTLSGTTSITSLAVSGKSEFSVTPNGGLPPGAYMAIVTVKAATGNSNTIAEKTFNVSFTVTKAKPTVQWPEISAAPNTKLSDIPLPGNGTGTPAGTFAWVSSSDTVGSELQTSEKHKMTFTPNDTDNYEILTNDVNVIVSDK